VNPINRERRSTESQRAYGPSARRRWVQGLPCCVRGCANGWIQNVHISPTGTGPSGIGRKGDYKHVVPMCKTHHDELHRLGQKTFERKHDIDLDIQACATQGAWERHENDLAD